jgi:hypothetical protein
MRSTAFPKCGLSVRSFEKSRSYRPEMIKEILLKKDIQNLFDRLEGTRKQSTEIGESTLASSKPFFSTILSVFELVLSQTLIFLGISLIKSCLIFIYHFKKLP